MKNLRTSLFFIASLIFLGTSCSKDETSETKLKGSISLSLQKVSTTKSTDAEAVSAVYISIKNSDSEYEYNMEKLTLISFNGGYITGNIELEEGDYTVEDFIVVNDLDTVVYMTPKEGSEFASYVDDPLPVSFTVSASDTSSVSLQVIPADLGDAEDYGYANFSFDIVDVTCDLDSGLVAYFPFDGNANDSTGNGFDGTEYYSTNYVTGIIGQAKDFDGSHDYIKLDSTMDGSNGLSFSFWLYTRGSNGDENGGVVISKYSLSSETRCFYVGTYGDPNNDYHNALSSFFYKYGSSTTYLDAVNSRCTIDSLPDNYPTDAYTILNPMVLPTYTWVHCVINVTESEIQAWVNDTLTMKKQREYNEYFNSDSQKTYIGNCPSLYQGSNNHLNGYLDELRVYNRGLTKAEIKKLYELR